MSFVTEVLVGSAWTLGSHLFVNVVLKYRRTYLRLAGGSLDKKTFWRLKTIVEHVADLATSWKSGFVEFRGINCLIHDCGIDKNICMDLLDIMFQLLVVEN